MSDEGQAYSRRSDPSTSRAVTKYRVNPAIQRAIIAWMRNGEPRACGKPCEYASDFEVFNAIGPHFTSYESAVRRQNRKLREDKYLKTVDPAVHQHLNPKTNRHQQCFKLCSIPWWGRRRFRRVLNGDEP